MFSKVTDVVRAACPLLPAVFPLPSLRSVHLPSPHHCRLEMLSSLLGTPLGLVLLYGAPAYVSLHHWNRMQSLQLQGKPMSPLWAVRMLPAQLTEEGVLFSERHWLQGSRNITWQDIWSFLLPGQAAPQSTPSPPPSTPLLVFLLLPRLQAAHNPLDTFPGALPVPEGRKAAGTLRVVV